uniref:BZIP domain-containing protein n=1 Tax=Globodera rostochiensis TaxID=31243 RepID=A0A914HKH7_GLORO
MIADAVDPFCTEKPVSAPSVRAGHCEKWLKRSTFTLFPSSGNSNAAKREEKQLNNDTDRLVVDAAARVHLQQQNAHLAQTAHLSHNDPFGSAIRFQLNQSAAIAGGVPSTASMFPPSFAPAAVGASPVGGVLLPPASSQQLLLNHFLLSTAPSTSSSAALNPFMRSSMRQPPPHHSQAASNWLLLDGMAPSTTMPESAFAADPSQQLQTIKELAAEQQQQQQQQQQPSGSSDISSFSFSSSAGSADSDGQSCSSSGSCFGGTQPNASGGLHHHHQRTSCEQNANNNVRQLQKRSSAAQLPQQHHHHNSNTDQHKAKKLLVRDEAYWERRRKNNDAAKRSRDSRRKKEDEVAVRAVVLEQENLQLRFEVERLRTDIERHRVVAFGGSLIAPENGAEVGGKVPICSATMAQLATVTAMAAMAKPMLNP